MFETLNEWINLVKKIALDVSANFIYSPILGISLLLVAMICTGQVGKKIGLPSLFWGQKKSIIVIHGCLIGVLVLAISYLGFLKDYGLWSNDNKHVFSQKSASELAEIKSKGIYSVMTPHAWAAGKYDNNTKANITSFLIAKNLNSKIKFKTDAPWIKLYPDGFHNNSKLVFFIYYAPIIVILFLFICLLIFTIGMFFHSPLILIKEFSNIVCAFFGFIIPILVCVFFAFPAFTVLESYNFLDNILGGGGIDRLGEIIAYFIFFLLIVLTIFPTVADHIHLTAIGSILVGFLFVITIYGFVSYKAEVHYHPHNKLLFLFLIPLLLLLSAWFNPYRYRLSCFNHEQYKMSGMARLECKNQEHLALEDVLPEDSSRPIVVFCLSGGGITASAWAGAYLSQLEEKFPLLAHDTILVTGASGGMVAGGFWANCRDNKGIYKRYLDFENDNPWNTFYDKLTQDVLTKTVGHMILNDFPRLFFPLPLKCIQNKDRGAILDELWEKNLALRNNSTCIGMKDLLKGEREKWRPPLAFTPTVVETGERMIISNLTFQDPEIQINRREQTNTYFPKLPINIKLSSAIRLSASFPLVSPACYIPMTNAKTPVRVVDAGYYDAWGVSLASNWLINHMKALKNRKLVFIEVNAYSKYNDRKIKNNFGRILRSTIDDLISPITAVLKARNSASIKNDKFVESLAEIAKLHHCEFKHFNFTSKVEASLSWKLTDKEKLQLWNESKDQITKEMPRLKEALL